MNVSEFLHSHGSTPDQISARECLQALLADMDRGLKGEGNIPMLPSFLSAQIQPERDTYCCVLDAGGTNLRTALARFDGQRKCHLENIRVCQMPGTGETLGYREFYEAIADQVRRLEHFRRVGFCFSYNVTLDRTLDGCLDFWCKEVRVPDAVGKPVGGSLKDALGEDCESVHVLNDSVAAMLGAGGVQVGVILGTGVNVCYSEKCDRIRKISEPLNSETMIISTEIGEFDKIPKSDFEQHVIDCSDAPHSAHAEKQCSGAYLGDVIVDAWHTAAREGLLPDAFREIACTLADISRYLAGESDSGIPVSAEAQRMARILIHRGAKIAAILCAGPILRASGAGETVRVAVEGSQYWKLTGFRDCFEAELRALLEPCQVRYEIAKAENACLIGAALAAFAQPM